MFDSDRFSKAPMGMQMVMVTRLWRNVIDANMHPLNLTQSRWELMAQLDRLGEGTIQMELATALGIEMPSLTRTLEQLEQRGLIERRRSDQDKRVRTVHFTAEGRALQGKADALRLTLNQQIKADISTEELAIFKQTLFKLAANLDRMDNAPGNSEE